MCFGPTLLQRPIYVQNIPSQMETDTQPCLTRDENVFFKSQGALITALTEHSLYYCKDNKDYCKKDQNDLSWSG